MLDAVCIHVTSSAASRDSAVKLMTDSYQFWVAHYNLRETFQSHIRFARKMQKYGDAFSKSSSIQLYRKLKGYNPIFMCQALKASTIGL